MIIKTNAESGQNQKFQRVYMCLIAFKKGFNECRPLFGLDGYHITGPQLGQLLATISIIGNNVMNPIAYAIIEAESLAI